MKIKTLKSFLLEGKHIKPGEVIDVQSGFTARELIRYGKAFAVAESTVIAKTEEAVAAPEAEATRKAGRPRKVKPETEIQ
jgi:hypothetical protein